MKLKHEILALMDRDLLRAVVDQLDVQDVDRRSRDDMTGTLSRSHRATPEILLEFLSETQIKVLCERVGLSPTGRRSALIELILGDRVIDAGGEPRTEEELVPTPARTPGKVRGEGARQTKRVTRYTYEHIREPRTPETGHTSLLPADEQVVTLPMDNGWSKALVVGKLSEGNERPVVVDMDPAADPVLLWSGKRNRREVPVLPLQRNAHRTDYRAGATSGRREIRRCATRTSLRRPREDTAR